MVEPNRAKQIGNQVFQHIVVLASVLAILWILELADLIFWHGGLDAYGIRPRTSAGFRHIFVAPWLHAGLGHLIANSVPFVILGWFVMLRRTSDFFVVALIAALVSGVGIWVFGASNSVHIGASGVIFGFLGFLVLRGYFERSCYSIALALVALLLYGGMLWGLLPGRTGVSWLGHLFGFVGGGLAAFLLADRD